MKIGINGRNIKEISNGPVYANEVDLIELGEKDLRIHEGKIDHDWLKKLSFLDTNFSIHAPYSAPRGLIDLGIIREQNFKVMEEIFKASHFLGVDYVVLHGDKVNGNPRKSFLNLLFNLKAFSKLAANYSITLGLENLPEERGFDRFGILPQELLTIIYLVREENLKVTLDIGHAFLSSKQYGFEITEFFDCLSPYVYHMHLHDNMGIPAEVNEKYGDQHLPMGKGKIDFTRIFERIKKIQPENLVLELKGAKRFEALENIDTLKRLKQTKKDYKLSMTFRHFLKNQ